jgi:hypothetical protein
MQKSGLQYVSVNPSDVAEWRRTVEGIYPALRQRSDFDAPMFDELLAVLARYRAEHGESP